MSKIVMIDDDPDDQIFYGRLFKERDKDLVFEAYSSAIDFMGEYKDKDQKPDLILLDLNMPKVSGLDFIQHISKQNYMNSVPVVVLTTSSSPLDMDDCYAAGIQSYFVKPTTYEECQSLVSCIHQYWFKLNFLIVGENHG